MQSIDLILLSVFAVLHFALLRNDDFIRTSISPVVTIESRLLASHRQVWANSIPEFHPLAAHA